MKSAVRAIDASRLCSRGASVRLLSEIGFVGSDGRIDRLRLLHSSTRLDVPKNLNAVITDTLCTYVAHV